MVYNQWLSYINEDDAVPTNVKQNEGGRADDVEEREKTKAK